MMTNEDRVLLIQKGENVTENLERLYFDNIGLWKMAIKPFIGRYDYEDMMQFVYICLDSAVKKYNHSNKFSSYAVQVIRRQINREFPKTYEKFYYSAHAMELKGRKKALEKQGIELDKQAELLGCTPEKLEQLEKVVISYESLIDLISEEDTEKKALENVYKKELWSIVARICPAEYEALKALYIGEMTMREAAKFRGVSHQSISEYKKKAFRKLRNSGVFQ